MLKLGGWVHDDSEPWPFYTTGGRSQASASIRIWDACFLCLFPHCDFSRTQGLVKFATVLEVLHERVLIYFARGWIDFLGYWLENKSNSTRMSV
jgi:hypothetical protein